MVMHGSDHALRSQFKVGDKVYFGRKRGEKTLGEIVRFGPKNAKVKQLEDRGSIRDYPIGTTWTVPLKLLTLATVQFPADKLPSSAPPPPVKREPLKYNPFAGIDNLLLEALASAYSGLSPENLTCDGEASAAHVQATRTHLNRVIRGCKLALNRDDLDEGEVFTWLMTKRDYERQRAERKSATA
jgi:hypothetical protein